MTSTVTGGRSEGSARPGLRAVGGALLVAGAVAALAGCSGAGADTTRAPHAGNYAIATPQPRNSAVPTATAGGYQVVAAGDPVRVELPGADLLAQVSGPDVQLPTPVPGQPLTAQDAPGVLTVSLTAASGSLDVPSSSFLGLDEERRPIALESDTDRVTVTPGHPATVHLSARFSSGHTTLSWQPAGRPVVTWDFVVEID